MTLPAGTRLGPYEILVPIGAGGMGEVYRARDTRLDRDVAVKILPEAFSVDPERLARFEREAKTLASLNHPHIAQIYGLETGNGGTALVMELVEGDDLSGRLARGAIPIPDALSIARQIAEALEAAHDRGIVHRDLKPANIKVRADGTVKVLDFGLAKAMDSSGGTSPDLMNSPTITSPATQLGMIIGTAAYMAPEQARGGSVDRRADIWAFGVVLFEMLSGQTLFAGQTVTDTLAAVVRNDPDWRLLPPATPRSVQRLLRRCLDRDVKRRLQSIAEARIVLDDPNEAEPFASAPAVGDRPRALRLLPWAIALVALAGAGGTALHFNTAGSSESRVRYLDVSFPPGVEPAPLLESGFNISPDGQYVLVTVIRDGGRRLHVRRLAEGTSVEIAESIGVTGSTFSPDSRSVAFVGSTNAVVAVSLVDQQRTLLARGADLAGTITWGSSGLVFSRDGALWLAPADGGSERQLTALDTDRREVFHANQMVLPNGRTILFSSFSSETGAERIEAVSSTGDARRVVLERATTPVWSSSGHLLFVRDGAILAAAFDPETAEVTGGAIKVIPAGIVAPTSGGGIGLRLSQSGDLLLLPNEYYTTHVESVARDGSRMGLPFPSARYMNVRLAPDGRRILLEAAGLRLDALDLERETVSRLTPDTPGTTFSIWSRDGRHIIFRRYNSPYWLSADGSGQQGTIPGGVSNDYPSGPGPDPDTFFSTRIGPYTAGDIFLLSRSGTAEPKSLIATPSYEGGAQLSPDGRWLVYVTLQSGQSEITVRRYPALDRQWQISAGFGVQPRWQADGREIFYRDGQHMRAVPFDGSRDEPIVGRPSVLFQDDFDLGQGITIANYDVTRDGRFLMLKPDSQGVGLRIVVNWKHELQRIMAEGGVR